MFREHNFSDIHDIAIYVSIKIIDVFAQRTQNTFVRSFVRSFVRLLVRILWLCAGRFSHVRFPLTLHMCALCACSLRAARWTATTTTHNHQHRTQNVRACVCVCRSVLRVPSHSIRSQTQRNRAWPQRYKCNIGNGILRHAHRFESSCVLPTL